MTHSKKLPFRATDERLLISKTSSRSSGTKGAEDSYIEKCLRRLSASFPRLPLPVLQRAMMLNVTARKVDRGNQFGIAARRDTCHHEAISAGERQSRTVEQIISESSTPESTDVSSPCESTSGEALAAEDQYYIRDYRGQRPGVAEVQRRGVDFIPLNPLLDPESATGRISLVRLDSEQIIENYNKISDNFVNLESPVRVTEPCRGSASQERREGDTKMFEDLIRLNSPERVIETTENEKRCGAQQKITDGQIASVSSEKRSDGYHETSERLINKASPVPVIESIVTSQHSGAQPQITGGHTASAESETRSDGYNITSESLINSTSPRKVSVIVDELHSDSFCAQHQITGDKILAPDVHERQFDSYVETFESFVNPASTIRDVEPIKEVQLSGSSRPEQGGTRVASSPREDFETKSDGFIETVNGFVDLDSPIRDPQRTPEEQHYDSFQVKQQVTRGQNFLQDDDENICDGRVSSPDSFIEVNSPVRVIEFIGTEPYRDGFSPRPDQTKCNLPPNFSRVRNVHVLNFGSDPQTTDSDRLLEKNGQCDTTHTAGTEQDHDVLNVQNFTVKENKIQTTEVNHIPLEQTTSIDLPEQGRQIADEVQSITAPAQNSEVSSHFTLLYQENRNCHRELVADVQVFEGNSDIPISDECEQAADQEHHHQIQVADVEQSSEERNSNRGSPPQKNPFWYQENDDQIPIWRSHSEGKLGERDRRAAFGRHQEGDTIEKMIQSPPLQQSRSNEPTEGHKTLPPDREVLMEEAESGESKESSDDRALATRDGDCGDWKWTSQDLAVAVEVVSPLECSACGCRLLKFGSCNRLTCVCGQSVCAVCRLALPANCRYEHFCQHERYHVHWPCESCDLCDLYELPPAGDKHDGPDLPFRGPKCQEPRDGHLLGNAGNVRGLAPRRLMN